MKEKVKIEDDRIFRIFNGALASFNADPFIIEDADTAKAVYDAINQDGRSTFVYNRFDEEFEDVCSKLDLSPDQARNIFMIRNNTEIIYICYAGDWQSK